MQNLEGTWTCIDNGTYYIRQKENNIYINGSNFDATSNEKWVNVGFGIINPDTSSVVVYWSDTPNSTSQSYGVEYLDASKEGVITKKSGSSYGYGNFTKIK